MTKDEKIAIAKDRYNRLINSPKNTKCPGVVKKLRRSIRQMEK